MNKTSKWSEVVAKLITQTQDGTCLWGQYPLAQRENLVGEVYVASVDGKGIAVYEYRYQNYISDFDSYAWTNDVAIEFVSPGGELVWRFPELPNRLELLEAVRFQVSGAESFLKRFLDDGGT